MKPIKFYYILISILCFALSANASKVSDPQDSFEKAMKLRKQGKLSASVEIFQSILLNHPQLQRARLELAVAYFQQLNFIRAKKLATIVLKDPKTPKTVKLKIKRFLSKIKSLGPRHTWTPSISLGFMYDSNVTAGPDNSVLTGFPTLSVTTKQSDQALTSQLGLSHRYISGKSYSIGKQKAGFLWLSQFNYYDVNYNSQDSLDLNVISLSTGPALIVANKWRAAINLQLDSTRLGGEKYASYTALNPNLTLINKSGKSEIGIDLFIQSRSYDRSIDLGRDSQYYAIGFSYGVLSVSDKFSYQIGLRPFKEDADLAQYSNSGIEWFGGFSYRKSQNTIMLLRYSRKPIKFDGLETGLSVKRDEKLDRIVLGIEHTFSSGRFKGWAVKAYSTFTNNSSNVGLFDFDRLQNVISLSRSF